jgi:hypothetical protein
MGQGGGDYLGGRPLGRSVSNLAAKSSGRLGGRSGDLTQNFAAELPNGGPRDLDLSGPKNGLNGLERTSPLAKSPNEIR